MTRSLENIVRHPLLMQIDKQNARLPGCRSQGGATPDDDQMKMKNENEKPKVES